MTAQFLVAIILFGLAVGFTAGLWFRALQRTEFRKIANFYRYGFIGLASCLALLVWAQAFAVIDANIGNAMMQGFTASTVLFVLFGWGRLTALGLKFDATFETAAE